MGDLLQSFVETIIKTVSGQKIEPNRPQNIKVYMETINLSLSDALSAFEQI